ncbi:GNAT acetyltransferase 2-domain-containing protein [Tribonema minus]|uniref:RNA cytidine acetyltransferase n=1 Tax=Tribonema minus TaxID=303371 RepID=A0A835Z409_9STRA|nr:GNAT acetyltransferase 2-domain-containing protein [Tribonema minus]
MVRKKVDSRVRALIENGVKTNTRSFFLLVGDHGKDQVVNLHYILSKARVATRPSVLWCYKKELGFSTHRQKRMRQLKRQKKSGLASAGDASEDPFELFITSTNVRWTYYRDTAKVLGQTFGMCVLQDFEALTPNLLARTIETVEGGGVVVLLLKTVASLQQLYTLTMDVHDRFRTEAHGDVVARFNERFMLSLADCGACLACDDELNVLPLSSRMRRVEALPAAAGAEPTQEQAELAELKASLEGTPPIGPLVSGAKTLDQARALLTFMEAISEKTLRTTVALTASRGRGKSAAIGLCLAGAIAYGYSNIFVTAPSPENLGTVFEFVLKGFDLLKYTEHMDYEVLQSSNPAFNKAVVRINVFRDHRQTIQYIQPHDSNKLAHCELLAIDEAAAIPLPLVKALLGPYLVFMSSTVNGYEGTGRALSLKLVDQLRKQQGGAAAAAAAAAAAEVHGSGRGAKGRDKVHEQRWRASADAAANAAKHGANAGAGRALREITLETPIRYATGDPVEAWLHSLLCLDSRGGMQRLVMGTPSPRDCELFYVDRDALFSYHKLSEAFLQRVMSLYTAAHYKNQPNDLQLLSDAPAHHLFVLLGPTAEKQGARGELPDVLCVIQVALEGQISKASVQAALAKGQRSSGDLIPWTLSQQFQDTEFAGLSGARIVRVATHPDVQGMGYGARAMQLMLQYFEVCMYGSGDDASDEDDNDDGDDDEEGASDADGADAEGEGAESEGEGDKGDANGNGAVSKALAKERLKPRKKLPPLLVPASQRKPERLHWLGVSYGVTAQLLRFWRRVGMDLVYLRQTTNELTGEHTGVMLRALRADGLAEAPREGWLADFATDCRRRVVNLYAHEFTAFDTATALTLIDAGQLKHSNAAAAEQGAAAVTAAIEAGGIAPQELSYLLTPHDLKRLELYARNMVDYHLITDLLPTLARLYFLGRLPQVLALFNKAVRKICNALRAVQERGVEEEIEPQAASARKAVAAAGKGMHMVPQTMDSELKEGAKQVVAGLKAQKDSLLDSLDLEQYAIKGSEADWDAALKKKGGGKAVSIKSNKPPTTVKGFVEDQAEDEQPGGHKKRKHKEGGGGGKQHKKKGK